MQMLGDAQVAVAAHSVLCEAHTAQQSLCIRRDEDLALRINAGEK